LAVFNTILYDFVIIWQWLTFLDYPVAYCVALVGFAAKSHAAGSQSIRQSDRRWRCEKFSPGNDCHW